MQRGGWWWEDPLASNRKIKRRILREMIAHRFSPQRSIRGRRSSGTTPPQPMSARRTSTAGSPSRPPPAGSDLGDKVRLILSHCDPTANLYDWCVCVRGNRVEQLWPISARGAIYRIH